MIALTYSERVFFLGGTLSDQEKEEDEPQPQMNKIDCVRAQKIPIILPD